MKFQRGVVLPFLILLLAIVVIGLLAVKVLPQVKQKLAGPGGAGKALQQTKFDVNNVGEVASIGLIYDATKQPQLTLTGVARKMGAYTTENPKAAGDYVADITDKDGKSLAVHKFSIPQPKPLIHAEKPGPITKSTYVEFAVNIKWPGNATKLTVKGANGTVIAVKDLSQIKLTKVANDLPHSVDIIYIVPKDQQENKTWSKNVYNFYCQDLQAWFFHQLKQTFSCTQGPIVIQADQTSDEFMKDKDTFWRTVSSDLQAYYQREECKGNDPSCSPDRVVQPGHYRNIFVQTAYIKADCCEYNEPVEDFDGLTFATDVESILVKNKQLTMPSGASIISVDQYGFYKPDVLYNYVRNFNSNKYNYALGFGAIDIAIDAANKGIDPDDDKAVQQYLDQTLGAFKDWVDDVDSNYQATKNLPDDAKKLLVQSPFLDQKQISDRTCGIPQKNVAPDQITKTGGVLHWVATENATQYNIYAQYDKSKKDNPYGGQVGSKDGKPITDNWFQIDGLKANTDNSFYIVAICEYWPGANGPGSYGQSEQPLSLAIHTLADAPVVPPQNGPVNPGGGQPPSGANPISCGTPANLTAKSKTNSSVTLGWDSVSGVDHYNIYQDGAFALTSNKDTSITVSGLAAATTYKFYINAICVAANGYGEGKTQEISVTTSAVDTGGGNGGNVPPPSSCDPDCTLSFRLVDNGQLALGNTSGTYYLRSSADQNPSGVAFTTRGDGNYDIPHLKNDQYTLCVDVPSHQRVCAPIFSLPYASGGQTVLKLTIQ